MSFLRAKLTGGPHYQGTQIVLDNKIIEGIQSIEYKASVEELPSLKITVHQWDENNADHPTCTTIEGKLLNYQDLINIRKEMRNLVLEITDQDIEALKPFRDLVESWLRILTK